MTSILIMGIRKLKVYLKYAEIMVKIRDYIKLFCSLLLSVIYAPHLLAIMGLGAKNLLFADVERMMRHENIHPNKWISLLYLLHTNGYFRSLFYYRIGPIATAMISWYRPGDKYFRISYRTKIGKGVLLLHPYSTILNAESIGDNFSCLQCTTIGKSKDERPIIGNNVSLGANVVVIGGVHIGNNVTVGAGSVVVKDLPDNCVAVGNPCKVIKFTK